MLLTQRRLIIKDVIPIIRRIVYDIASVDHRNSENLEEIETTTIIAIFACYPSCSVQIFDKFNDINIISYGNSIINVTDVINHISFRSLYFYYEQNALYRLESSFVNIYSLNYPFANDDHLLFSCVLL